MTVVAGMCVGADSIDDLDMLRTGGMDKAFARIHAPSTIGSFLRAFTHLLTSTNTPPARDPRTLGRPRHRTANRPSKLPRNARRGIERSTHQSPVTRTTVRWIQAEE